MGGGVYSRGNSRDAFEADARPQKKRRRVVPWFARAHASTASWPRARARARDEQDERDERRGGTTQKAGYCGRHRGGPGAEIRVNRTSVINGRGVGVLNG